jgi:hypothetical protein
LPFAILSAVAAGSAKTLKNTKGPIHGNIPPTMPLWHLPATKRRMQGAWHERQMPGLWPNGPSQSQRPLSAALHRQQQGASQIGVLIEVSAMKMQDQANGGEQLACLYKIVTGV